MEKEQWEENEESVIAEQSSRIWHEVSTRFSASCHQRPWSDIGVSESEEKASKWRRDV